MLYLVQIVTMLLVTILLMVEWGATTNPVAAGFVGLIVSLIATRCWVVWVQGAQQIYDKEARRYVFVFPGDPGYRQKPSLGFRIGRLTARLLGRR